MTDEHAMESYLAALRAHLGPMTLSEREEIVREIAAHLRDSAEENGIDTATAVARLGPAEELAAQYREGLLIRRASQSVSPVMLLRGALRVATKGISGAVVFVTGLLGYTAGVGMVVGALLKPFFPASVGIWEQRSETITSGLQSITTRSTPHELLGMWAIPLFLTVGSLTLLATTMFIRTSLRTSQRLQARL